MKQLKRSFALLLFVALFIINTPTSAQTFEFDLQAMLLAGTNTRAREVMVDNEYTHTGYEKGNFYNHPLLLDGLQLDYISFQIKTEGELTVIKGAAVTGETINVPFYLYLRRDGNKVLIPGRERPNPKQMKVELSEILKHAKGGDQLVIEAVRREDGPVKRILNIREGGC